MENLSAVYSTVSLQVTFARASPSETRLPGASLNSSRKDYRQTFLNIKSFEMENSLTGWLKPASKDRLNLGSPKPTPASKRKRSSDGGSNIESTKKQKPTKKAALKKTTSGGKGAEQSYKKIIADVDKKVNSLDARVKKMGPNSRSVTSDDYAEAMVELVEDIESLSAMDARLALNGLLYIGRHAHGDRMKFLNSGRLRLANDMVQWKREKKKSGCGGTKEPFAELDDLMLSIFADLKIPSANSTNDSSLPKVPHCWTPADADVGVFKTGRPNKQQRGQIDRQKASWMKERKVAAKERREKVEDWITNAIEELEGERVAIKDYGLDGNFEKSIAKLVELKTGETSGSGDEGHDVLEQV